MVSTEISQIIFSLDELQQFGSISKDQNPLHLSPGYARKTPYGEQVVFGVLGVLKCLQCLKDRAGFCLEKIAVDFRGPLFTGISYKLVKNDQHAEKATLKVYDGSRLLLKATLVFAPGEIVCDDFDKAPSFESLEPKSAEYHDPNVFAIGKKLDGTYTPNIRLKTVPFNLTDLSNKGIGINHVSTLLCSTYLIGMRLPGQQALFSKLRLQYPNPSTNSKSNAAIDYTLSIKDFDTRFQLLKLDASYANEKCGLLASGELQAFVRPVLPTISSSLLSSLLPNSERLAGKVALITGASRGFGAMLAQTLASQGCQTLVNYHRSVDEAQKVAAQFPEHISLLQGDVSDAAWCMTTKQSIEERYGRLDYLICNACPPIIALRFEAETVARMNTFIAKSISLVSIPMSIFLSMLAKSNGWNIVISSIYTVEDTPPELSHYVSAKFAVEGLLKAVTIENEEIRSLLVRPPKLLTDQTNTPLGREGAIPTVEIATQFINHLLEQKPPTGLDILEFSE